MVKKLFEVEYDDDLHMANAADDPDYKRGLLYNDEGKLKGHAKMREVDEDELDDRYAEYDYDDEDDDLERADEIFAEILIAFLITAAPHVKRWWTEKAAPGVKGLFSRVKSIGHKDNTLNIQNEQVSSQQLVAVSQTIDPKVIQTKLGITYKDYCENMNSKEAQKTFVEIIILASLLAERIKKLSSANITNESITGDYLGWQNTVNKLSSKELIDSVNRILEGDTKLFDANQITTLERILGRSLYENGQYVPIESSEFHERLMPRANENTQDNM